MIFSIDFFGNVLGLENKKGLGVLSAHSIVTNSNEINQGDCFLGLVGNKFDGGDFFVDALKRGAIGLILNKKYEEQFLNVFFDYPDAWAFFIDDTKIALINLAKKWRKLFSIPIIAVTGSVGKTTTKELIKSILESTGSIVCATKSSQNGSIGLPLTILSMRKHHEIAVFEFGIQKPNEMDLLIDIVQSVNYTIITTVLPAHIVYFNNIEKIIEEKLKLQRITKDLLIVDLGLKKYVFHKNIITFGDSESADVFYYSLSTKINIEMCGESKKYCINAFFHRGINHCIAAAFALCYFLKINTDQVIKAIESFKRVDGRFSIHHLASGGIVINDCWNAAHGVVMLKSIEAFEQFPTNKKKIMVLADMLEQGAFTEESHDLIINKINVISDEAIEKIFYIGPLFAKSISKNIRKNVEWRSSFIEVAEEIFSYLDNKYCILFKGSNGTKLFYYVNKYINNQIEERSLK